MMAASLSLFVKNAPEIIILAMENVLIELTLLIWKTAKNSMLIMTSAQNVLKNLSYQMIF